MGSKVIAVAIALALAMLLTLASFTIATNDSEITSVGLVTDSSLGYSNLMHTVLHPNNLSWNPYEPKIGEEDFLELCPETGKGHRLDGWQDANNDKRISAFDPVYFTSAASSYHVENVPWTLFVNNTATGNSMYLDSVLDYEAVNLSYPEGTAWNEVCDYKDRFILENLLIDNADFKLSVGDVITLRNSRTEEEADFLVTEVTIDLVVSSAWRVERVPALTSIGFTALVGLLAIVATSTLVRRRKRR